MNAKNEIKKYENRNLPTNLSPIVSIAIVIGTRHDIDAIQESITVTIRRKHFNCHIGWELKDCVIVGLPQKYRFMLLESYERKETPEMGFFILFCHP